MGQLTWQDGKGLLLPIYMIGVGLVGLVFEPSKAIMGGLLGIAIVVGSFMIWQSVK